MQKGEFWYKVTIVTKDVTDLGGSSRVKKPFPLATFSVGPYVIVKEAFQRSDRLD